MSLVRLTCSSATGTNWTSPSNATARDSSFATHATATANPLVLKTWATIPSLSSSDPRKISVVVVGKIDHASASNRLLNVRIGITAGVFYTGSITMAQDYGAFVAELNEGSWGLSESGLYTNINDANFEVQIERGNITNNPTISIDFVYIIFEYKEANAYKEFGDGRMFVAQFQDQGIIADGAARPLFDRGSPSEPFYTTGLTAPITAPSIDNSASAVASGSMIGDKRAYVTFRRISDGTRSNPSPASIELNMDSQALTVFNIPVHEAHNEASSTDIRREVWVNVTGSGSAFLAAELDNNTDTSTVIDISDEVGVNRELLEFVNNDTPPAARYLAPFKERIVGFGERVLSGTTNVAGSTNLVNISTTGIKLRQLLNSSHVDKFIEFAGDSQRYRITAVNSPECVTISPAAPASLVLGTAFRIYSRDAVSVSWSQRGLPQQWNTTNKATFAVAESDSGSGLMPHQGRVLCFMKRHVGTFNWDEDPAQDGSLAMLVAGRGALESCVATAQGTIFALDTVGIYRYTGGASVEDIDAPIRPLIEGRAGETLYVDWSKADRFWAMADERHGMVHFFVVTNSSVSGYPEHSLTFDYLVNSWYILKWNQPLTCGGTVLMNDGRIAPLVAMGGTDSGTNAYFWEFWSGNCDAINDPTHTYRGTATSVGASTLTDTGATFTIANLGLAGATVEIYSGTGSGQKRTITSNTGTQLTVNAAWSPVLDTTSKYVIGPIDVVWKSGWLTFDLPLLRKRLHELRLYWTPNSSLPSIIDIEVFKDYEATAQSAKVETASEGSSVYPSDTTYAISTSQNQGFVRIPVEGVWAYVYSVRASWKGTNKERPILDQTGLFAQNDDEVPIV